MDGTEEVLPGSTVNIDDSQIKEFYKKLSKQLKTLGETKMADITTPTIPMIIYGRGCRR
jgi:hypothetical protein